jgi:transcriptional regulator with XRE-family HTH domain
MQIGIQLFDLRQKTGESLQEVADKVGVSKAHIWELEKGRSKNPSFELVRKLADHYSVPIDVLTGDQAAPDKDTMQIERLHRGLEALTKRDRQAVEALIKTLSLPSQEASK